jgi:dipeptidyl aminopeptidase/acylaminoacyl peptidase
MLFGGAIEDNQDLARTASPVTYVSKDDPPFLLVHGDADGTVPFEHAEILYEAQQKAGVDTTLVRIRGGGHGIGGQEVNDRVTAFFDKHLRDQDLDVSDEPIKADQPKRRRR